MARCGCSGTTPKGELEGSRPTQHVRDKTVLSPSHLARIKLPHSCSISLFNSKEDSSLIFHWSLGLPLAAVLRVILVTTRLLPSQIAQ